MIDPALLEVLACPACKSPVELEPAGGPSEGRLRCRGCGRRYPMRDGIPVLLAEEAQPPSSGSGQAA